MSDTRFKSANFSYSPSLTHARCDLLCSRPGLGSRTGSIGELIIELMWDMMLMISLKQPSTSPIKGQSAGSASPTPSSKTVRPSIFSIFNPKTRSNSGLHF